MEMINGIKMCNDEYEQCSHWIFAKRVYIKFPIQAVIQQNGLTM